jgi:hypothetical protein
MRAFLLSLAILVTTLLAAPAAQAWEGQPLWMRPGPPVEMRSSFARIELGADLQNLFKFRNDVDFDRTRPFYDPFGQTVGAFATVFRPRAVLHILERLRIVYELEIGLNFWNRNNPDEQAALAPDVFVMKHREIYGEGELVQRKLTFRAGYSYFRDPTGLFLAHWIGNAQLWWTPRRELRAGLFVGQVPDQVYDGISNTENNFKRDIWVFGGMFEAQLGRWLQASGAVSALVDTHLVGQARKLACPSVHLQGGGGRWSGYLDAALQAGTMEGQALSGGDETHVAWALQAGGRWHSRRFDFGANLLMLSPDDRYDGNGRSYAFLYSGKSRSATLLLTEDEIRDWYDNLDERMSMFKGGFFQNRAGLMVADARATWYAHRYFNPSLVLGVSSVLDKHNALESSFVGVESDLVLEFRASSHLMAHLVGSLLVPGAAGAALINRINRSSTDAQYQIEASLLVRY